MKKVTMKAPTVILVYFRVSKHRTL